MNIIEIRDLPKHFGHVHALDGLRLGVETGEICGSARPAPPETRWTDTTHTPHPCRHEFGPAFTENGTVP